MKETFFDGLPVVIARRYSQLRIVYFTNPQLVPKLRRCLLNHHRVIAMAVYQ